MGLCRSYDTFICSLLTLVLVLLRGVDNERVSCDSVVISNGSVFRTDDTALSNTLVVQCHQGFYLHPADSSQINCTDGYVSSPLPLPECRQKRNCLYTCDIQNGYCKPNDTELFQPGKTVETVCDTGYALNTSYSLRTCGQDGKWTPKQPPSCVLSGSPCKIRKSEVVEYFLNPTLEGTVPHNEKIKVGCKKGYKVSGEKGSSKSVNVTCNDGHFDKRLHSLCAFVGVDIQISYNYTKDDKTHSTGDVLTFDKGENVTLICKVYANTTDGLPYPEVTWLYPPRLRDYVEFREGDSFVHTDYIESLQQDYSISVENTSREEDVQYAHYAQGTLKIRPTMEVHTGEYTCYVKLVNFSDRKAVTLKIKADFVIAMYFLLIIPVVLFVIVHCFYRKATLSPFPAPNKLTKDMMQEVDKKKKLEEMKANPAYQHIQVMGAGEKNHRGRRGAVVDL